MTTSPERFGLMNTQLPRLECPKVVLTWADAQEALTILYPNLDDSNPIVTVFTAGVREVTILACLLLLRSAGIASSLRSLLLEILADFVIHGTHTSKHAKLACVEYLWNMPHNNPTNHPLAVSGEQVEATTAPTGEDIWNFLTADPHSVRPHSSLQYQLLCEKVLSSSDWWVEFREYCQCRMMTKREQRHDAIRRTANQATYWMWRGARSFEEGLSRSTQFFTKNILEATGERACQYLEPATDLLSVQVQQPQQQVLPPNDPPLSPSRSAVRLTRTYTDAAKRVSESTRITAQQAIRGIRDASQHGIAVVTEKLPPVTTMIPHHKDGQVILEAAGQVGMASLGAVTIMSEAVVESTREVYHTAATVTANVIQHKYGPDAGQTIRDAADTVDNVIRTVSYVAMLKGSIITQIVVKDTGKAHLTSRMEMA